MEIKIEKNDDITSIEMSKLPESLEELKIISKYIFTI